MNPLRDRAQEKEGVPQPQQCALTARGQEGVGEAEGAAREGRTASGGKEEDEDVARSYQGTVFSGKLQQVVCRATDR